MNQSVPILVGRETPIEQLRSAEKRLRMWEVLKKVLPSLSDYREDLFVYIVESGTYVIGTDTFVMFDEMKKKSPNDYMGSLFRLKEARQWLSMGQ